MLLRAKNNKYYNYLLLLFTGSLHHFIGYFLLFCRELDLDVIYAFLVPISFWAAFVFMLLKLLFAPLNDGD